MMTIMMTTIKIMVMTMMKTAMTMTKTMVTTILTMNATMTTTIDCEYFLISAKSKTASEIHALNETRSTDVIRVYRF